MLLALTDVIWRVKSPKMSLYPSFFLLFLLGGRAAAVDSESALEDVVVVVVAVVVAVGLSPSRRRDHAGILRYRA